MRMTFRERDIIHSFITYKELNNLAKEIGISRSMIQRIYYGKQDITEDKKWIYQAIVDRAKRNSRLKSKELSTL